MNLDILQGLLGGVNSGLGSILTQRQQQAENEQKARATAVLEEENRRQAQVAEWQQRKDAYDALVGGQEYDPTDPAVAPLVGKLPFHKAASGKLFRPLTPQEQKIDLDNKMGNISLEGQQFLRDNPSVLDNYDTAMKVIARFGLDPRMAPKTLDYVKQAAEAEYGPQAANNAAQRENALTIANIQAGASKYSADKMAERTNATADDQMERLRFQMANRPVDSKKFDEWKLTFLARPENRKKYNEIASAQGGVTADMLLLDAYREMFKPQFPEE